MINNKKSKENTYQFLNDKPVEKIVKPNFNDNNKVKAKKPIKKEAKLDIDMSKSDF